MKIKGFLTKSESGLLILTLVFLVLMVCIFREIQTEEIAGVLEAFEGFYEEFLKTEDLSLLKDRYEKSLVNMGRRVCVLDPKGEWTGTARGIDIYGRLLVEPDGAQELRAVESGEVSVRGVYGYV